MAAEREKSVGSGGSNDQALFLQRPGSSFLPKRLASEQALDQGKTAKAREGKARQQEEEEAKQTYRDSAALKGVDEVSKESIGRSDASEFFSFVGEAIINDDTLHFFFLLSSNSLFVEKKPQKAAAAPVARREMIEERDLGVFAVSFIEKRRRRRRKRESKRGETTTVISRGTIDRLRAIDFPVLLSWRCFPQMRNRAAYAESHDELSMLPCNQKYSSSSSSKRERETKLAFFPPLLCVLFQKKLSLFVSFLLSLSPSLQPPKTEPSRHRPRRDPDHLPLPRGRAAPCLKEEREGE